jgi:hypothetical protein
VKTVRLAFSDDAAPAVVRRGMSLNSLSLPPNREKTMKTWQILLVIWMMGVGFWIANQFNRQNIERMKKRSARA